MAAGAAYLFGVSLALGAFFAGMILAESELSHRAAEESLPLRDAFAVLFFVAVGMLFDPAIVSRDPLPVLATVLIIVIGKSVLAFLIVMLFRMPVNTAIIVAVSLAQVGEFSFILCELGVDLGILPEAGRDLMLGGAIISIVLNPLAFWAAGQFLPALEQRLVAGSRKTGALPSPTEKAEGQQVEALIPVEHPTTLTGHTVLIGYGRVGTVVADRLQRDGAPFVVIEDAENPIKAALAAGIEVVRHNGATSRALELANIGAAKSLFVAIPNAFEAGQAVEQGRKANAQMLIVARAHSDEEADYLEQLGANHVVVGEREIGLGMLDRRDRRDGSYGTV